MGLTLGDLNTKRGETEPSGKTTPPPSKRLLTPMSTVEAKEASYLISPYLPRGMLAIMGGVSGSELGRGHLKRPAAPLPKLAELRASARVCVLLHPGE